MKGKKKSEAPKERSRPTRPRRTFEWIREGFSGGSILGRKMRQKSGPGVGSLESIGNSFGFWPSTALGQSTSAGSELPGI